MQRYSTDEHPISRLIRFMESAHVKNYVQTQIRAHSGREICQRMAHEASMPAPSKEERRQRVLACLRPGATIMEIKERTGMNHEAIMCVLGQEGIDFSKMAQEKAIKQKPTKAIGLKVREQMEKGFTASTACKYVGIGTRCGMLSLAMVGGYK